MARLALAHNTRRIEMAALGTAEAVTWLFGIGSALLTLDLARSVSMVPGMRDGVFGVTEAGTVREALGLTMGGKTSFLAGTPLEAMAGMEGPLLAVAMSFAVVLALLVSLVQHRAGRIVGAVILLAWSSLWMGNAAWLAVKGTEPVLALVAVGLAYVTLCAARRLPGFLREV